MALVSDQWALVRAGAVKLEPFLQLLAGLKDEQDHTVLDEVVGRLSWLEHRGVDDAGRPAFQRWIRSMFARSGAELGWEPAAGEDDERRLRRAAVLRALVLVGRDPAVAADAIDRFQRHIARHAQALDPNLLDIVVAAAARAADEKRFDELRQHAASELDPAAKRRYLHALAMVEQPALVQRAVDLALDPFVQMQDFASYLGDAAREPRHPRRRLAAGAAQVGGSAQEGRLADDPPAAGGGAGSLPERRHLDEVERFLAAHELSAARQAVAQTLERLRADVALRERLLPETAAFLGTLRS